jgi:hypothetical protein
MLWSNTSSRSSRWLPPMISPIPGALARWIPREPKHEVHVRTLLRGERLPGLRTADDIHAAAQVLVEADWLSPPPRGNEFGRRGRVAYPVNPRLWALV